MIYLFDKNWQLPAKTEQQAYESLDDIDSMNIDSDSLYIAFPWANLIDAIDHNWDSKNMYLSTLKQISKAASQQNYKNISHLSTNHIDVSIPPIHCVFHQNEEMIYDLFYHIF